MQPSPISNRSLEQLEEELISFSQRMNGFEYELLVLIREFDIRQGWRSWKFNNCAEWLNFKCGITVGTAREKVRVARGLFDLPLCSEAFAAGKLSYSKARALTRVADCRTEPELLDFALYATASMVDDHCQQLRNAQRKKSTKDANRAHAARYLSRTIHEDGSMTISIQLPKESADLVMKAIDIAVDDSGNEQDSHTNESEESFFQKQADALVEVARGYLAGGSDKKSSTADHYQVMVHVDETALRNEGGYTIQRNFEGKWSFKTGNGKVIPELPMFRADYYENPSGRPSGVTDLDLIRKYLTKSILFVSRWQTMLLGCIDG